MELNNMQDAQSFADTLNRIKLPNYIQIGHFYLNCTHGIKNKIEGNNDPRNLLRDNHEYTFIIASGILEISLQLYKNTSNHYRLFCFTRINNIQGMTFSMNLTTEKESDNIIYLIQKAKFAEQLNGNKELAEAYRRQKQKVFGDLLKNVGIDITENNDIILGIFDPKKGKFINTSIDQFLNDFIVISLLKGHFQGNKGYQLEILPTYAITLPNKSTELKQQLPAKLVNNKTERAIPIGLRYKILERDKSTCCKCGRNPQDGIKLHIDHKLPYSLGGLTEYNNLRTLCHECNIGKSNKFIDS